MAAKNKCTNCKKYFIKESMIKVTAGKFCTQDCIKSYGMNNPLSVIEKARKKQAKDDLLRKKLFKANDTRLQHKLTQLAFNKLRRMQELLWFKERGLEPECISCGKKRMDWCCGHFKTVGSQGSLRYSEINTYLQCNRYCNRALSGNINGNRTSRGYLKGLEHRFGVEKSAEIIRACNVDTIKKWKAEELIEMRNQYNAEIRRLESMGKS